LNTSLLQLTKGSPDMFKDSVVGFKYTHKVVLLVTLCIPN